MACDSASKGTFVADVLPEKASYRARADRKVSNKPIIQQVAQRPHNDGVPDPRLIPMNCFRGPIGTHSLKLLKTSIWDMVTHAVWLN